MKLKLVALVIVFFVAVPAFPHHGNASYDLTKVVVLKGAVVTKYLWANPHVIIQFDAKNEKGEMLDWTVEAGTPQTLVLSGWGKSLVHVGDVLTIYMNQSKTGHPVGRVNKIVFADGTELKDSALGYDKAP